MKTIEGAVTAAAGFSTGAVHAGIRASQNKKDLALIVSDTPCTAAAVYTSNKVKAAPLHITRKHLENGQAQAIIVNSGNANAACPQGLENAQREAAAAARKLGLNPEDILVASTGVIGQRLPIEIIEQGVEQIVLGQDWKDTAQAILTTDTVIKEAAIEFEMDGKVIHMGGIAKGSGMIHPNMGTMLCFITTDAKISREDLEKALKADVKTTFNRISVDGDTSTNDMVIVLANGKAGNETVDQTAFTEALHTVMESLAKQIAADGEGSTRLLTATVLHAKSEEQAETLAMSVCSSSLVKAAVFGADANWGRVLCALGYAKTDFDPDTVSIAFASAKGTILCAKDGKGLDFDEEKAKEILLEHDIQILCDLHEGNAQASCWGCDLTYEYVKINGDYRT